MRSTISTRAPHRRTFSIAEADERAGQLVLALAALDASDPDRPLLRAQAIEAWLPMAYRLARRYSRYGDLADDLCQTAALGLVKAVDRFDPDRGTDFTGFAVPTIVGEMKRYFRDRTWAVRVPRRLKEMRSAIQSAQVELNHSLQRSPTVADVAAYLEVSQEAVLEGLEGSGAYSAVSLSMPVAHDGEFELGDTLGAEDHGYHLVELHAALPEAMAGLTDRERHIIAMRFYGNLTQASIAEQIGVSQMHISRVLAGALVKLRVRLADAA